MCDDLPSKNHYNYIAPSFIGLHIHSDRKENNFEYGVITEQGLLYQSCEVETFVSFFLIYCKQLND